jgi:hypothetical protein
VQAFFAAFSGIGPLGRDLSKMDTGLICPEWEIQTGRADKISFQFGI